MTSYLKGGGTLPFIKTCVHQNYVIFTDFLHLEKKGKHNFDNYTIKHIMIVIKNNDRKCFNYFRLLPSAKFIRITARNPSNDETSYSFCVIFSPGAT